MDDALGDALMVEMRDLLAQQKVFQQGRPALAAVQGVLVIGQRQALVAGQQRLLALGLLVQLTARPQAERAGAAPSGGAIAIRGR